MFARWLLLVAALCASLTWTQARVPVLEHTARVLADVSAPVLGGQLPEHEDHARPAPGRLPVPVSAGSHEGGAALLVRAPHIAACDVRAFVCSMHANGRTAHASPAHPRVRSMVHLR